MEESVSFKIGLNPEGLARKFLREKGLSDAEIEAAAAMPGFASNIGFLAKALAEAKGNRELRIRMLEESGYSHESAVAIAMRYGGPPSIDWLNDVAFHRDKNRELKTAIAISVVALALFCVMVATPVPEWIGLIVGCGSLGFSLFGFRLIYDNLSKRKKLAEQDSRNGP